MSIHEQHLHPADFVQHLDNIRLYSFERVHLGREISGNSLQTIGIESFSIPQKLSAYLKHDLPGVGYELTCCFVCYG
jgi:hypothetical protein